MKPNEQSEIYQKNGWRIVVQKFKVQKPNKIKKQTNKKSMKCQDINVRLQSSILIKFSKINQNYYNSKFKVQKLKQKLNTIKVNNKKKNRFWRRIGLS